MKKYICSLLLVVIISVMFSTVVFADNPITSMAGYESGANSAKLSTIGSKIYGIILIVGSAVTLGAITITGVKYIMAAPSEKADLKKNLIGLVIGVVILVCAVGLLTIFKKVGEQVSSKGTSMSGMLDSSITSSTTVA